MKRRRFLQYMGLSSTFSLLCNTVIVEDANAINISHNLDLEKASSLQNITDLNVNYTFDDYVVGNSNKLAFSSALNIAALSDVSHSPLFLFSSRGLGKTHLLHAIGNKIQKLNPHAKIKYRHAERLFADYIKAKRNQTIDDFRKPYLSLDILLLDDVHLLPNNRQVQIELYHLLSKLINTGKKVVVTSDRAPYEIETFDENLKAALGWGVTQDIVHADHGMRVAIVKSEAKRYNTVFPDDVTQLIARCIRFNIRELKGAVRYVITRSDLTHQPIDHTLTNDALVDYIRLQLQLLANTRGYHCEHLHKHLFIRHLTVA